MNQQDKNTEILRLLNCLEPYKSEFQSMNRDIEFALQTFGKIHRNSCVSVIHFKSEERENNKKNNFVRQDTVTTSNNDLSKNPKGIECKKNNLPIRLIQEERHDPDPFLISKSRKMNKRVTLNVGGIRHEVMWRMLEQIPESRLGLLSQVFYSTYALSKITSFRQIVMMTFLNIAQIILWLKTNSISIGILYQYVYFKNTCFIDIPGHLIQFSISTEQESYTLPTRCAFLHLGK